PRIAQRELDDDQVAVHLTLAEEFVVLHLAGRKLGRNRACTGRVDLESELVAIHVVTVGDVEPRFERALVERARGKAERLLGRKQLRFLRADARGGDGRERK